jgi:hypothetical protein
VRHARAGAFAPSSAYDAVAGRVAPCCVWQRVPRAPVCEPFEHWALHYCCTHPTSTRLNSHTMTYESIPMIVPRRSCERGTLYIRHAHAHAPQSCHARCGRFSLSHAPSLSLVAPVPSTLDEPPSCRPLRRVSFLTKQLRRAENINKKELAAAENIITFLFWKESQRHRLATRRAVSAAARVHNTIYIWRVGCCSSLSSPSWLVAVIQSAPRMC